jgi:hypothetical protein
MSIPDQRSNDRPVQDRSVGRQLHRRGSEHPNQRLVHWESADPAGPTGLPAGVPDPTPAEPDPLGVRARRPRLTAFPQLSTVNDRLGRLFKTLLVNPKNCLTTASSSLVVPAEQSVHNERPSTGRAATASNGSSERIREFPSNNSHSQENRYAITVPQAHDAADAGTHEPGS